jgi:hypothetical protein
MTLSTLDNALWAGGLIGHVALVLVLVLKKRVRDFPVFTGFIGFEILTTVVLFVVLRRGSRHAYFLAYWITGFGDYFFQLAVILEVARDVLRPTGAWVREARQAFIGWGTAGLIASAGLSLLIGPPQARGFDLWDVRITVFTSLLTIELFIAMSAAANRLGLQQRSYVFAIGQGFFIWMLISLIEELGHTVLGWDREFVVFVHIRMSVYLAVLVYWMVAFWLPERVRGPLSPEMNAYLVALHQRVQYDLTSVDEPPL